MRIGLLICSLIIIQSCLQRDRLTKCGRFKEGRFLITDKPSDRRYIINRFDSVQTELDEHVDSITRSKIKWIGPCKYQLLREFRRKNTIDTNSKRMIEKYINQVPLEVNITFIGKDYYVFESKKEGIDFVYTDTMWVLK